MDLSCLVDSIKLNIIILLLGHSICKIKTLQLFFAETCIFRDMCIQSYLFPIYISEETQIFVFFSQIISNIDKGYTSIH